ncbi:MAG: CHAD domain-containing protein, partial [Solirubrobacteraceae bacterium]
PAAFRATLAAHLELQAEPSRAVERAYYDTFEGLVQQADMSLVWEDGRLKLTHPDGGEIAGCSQPRRPKVVTASDLPPGALRDRLAPVIGVRAATTLVHVRVRRRPLRVLDSEHKTVAHLAIEEPSVVLGKRRHTRLAPRLSVGGVRGYDKVLARVRRVMEDKLGLPGANTPLAHEAILRAGGVPRAVSSRSQEALEPRQRADRAAAAILARMIEAIEANLPGTLADVDSEFLHDLRVAVRRTRSVQRQLRGVFPCDIGRFRAEFRWLQQVTGPTRDLDVYVLDFDAFVGSLLPAQRSDLEPLRLLLTERRTKSQRQMVRALRSQRAQTLLSEWKRFVLAFPELSDDDRPDAATPIVDFASRRIGALYRQMIKRGTRIDSQSPAVALHDLRKSGKELRYLLEFFGGLFAAATVDPMVKALKSLQDTLGRFQDCEVQAAMLRSLADDTATKDDGAAAVMAMGVLVERLATQQAQARADFVGRFAQFGDKRHRAAVRKTFA